MKYQVLLVDDEEIVCRGMRQFVKWKEHGFEVADIASDVDGAIGLLEKLHVDVVFMDVRMPGKSGLELLKVIEEEYPEIKCIILSGYADFSYAQEAIRHGAVDYLTKPVRLGEVEALLDRLQEEFERQKEKARVHSDRLEGLMMSAARGYSGGDFEKYGLNLPESWCGMAMSLRNHNLPEEEIQEKKETIKQQLLALEPGTVILEDEIFSLFVLTPCRSEESFDSLVSLLEQLCVEFRDWGCGVSKKKSSEKDLHTAYEEASQALRYGLAGTKERVIFYRNIENLFTAEFETLEELVPELLKRLADPETRESVCSLLKQRLEAFYEQNPGLNQFQTACLRLLIELNSRLRGCVSEESLHERLNHTLSLLLLSQEKDNVCVCVLDYVKWLVECLNQSDGQQLGKGVIREIQLFIRKHYSENITLNALAEQFYLHPNYLSRIFKEKTGKNFVEYLTEVRMEKVKELLRTSDRKIIEICAMTGYDNPWYFSKVFKQYTGMTPKEYREQR
jgi:two-component system response regulator YesN